MGGGPGGPGGFGPQYPPGPPPKNNVPLIVGAIVAVVVLLAGGGGAMFLALRGDEQKAAPTASTPSAAAAPRTPAAPSASPTPPSTPDAPTGNPLAQLNTRDDDPEPLTLDELFEKKKFKVGNRTYTRAARKEDKNCANAVQGAGLRAALRKGKCTQVLRASYSSHRGKIVGTVGIINLEDLTAVEKATAATDNARNYLAPLRGSGPARSLGSGTALGAQVTRGHYLVLSWLQYADGHRPSSTKDKKLNRHGDDVFEHTAGAALIYRMLMGEPRP